MNTRLNKNIITWALSLLMASACTKVIHVNPEAHDYAAAPFGVEISETRCYKEYSYSIPQDKAPVITRWNTVTVRAVSDDNAFDGVNVSSSNPSVVSVTRSDDPAEYVLAYVSDGQAEIRVWNALEEKSFRIEAREVVELEGLLMRVGGREFIVKADATLPGPYDADSPYEWPNERITDGMVCFDETALESEYSVEIVDIVPENCSWRSIEKFMIVNDGTYGYDCSNWFDPDHRMGGVYTRNAIRDVSDITGRSVTTLRYSSEQGRTFNTKYLVVTFRTDCSDFSTPQKDVRFSTAICGMKVRR